jgi:hypothetical protein
MAGQDDDGGWWIGAHAFMDSDTFHVYITLYQIRMDVKIIVDMRNRDLTQSC